MKHNVVYVFVILVDDDYCVAIHDLSPVLTALFSFELGGFNNNHINNIYSLHEGIHIYSTDNQITYNTI